MDRAGLFIAAFLLMSVIASAAEAYDPEMIFRDAGRGGRYVAPSKQELETAERAFISLFRNESTGEAERQLASLHFVLYRFKDNGSELLCVAEHGDHKKGRGIYLFWQGRAGFPVLEVPHSFSDLYTGEIGFKIAREGRFRAAAFNTVRRKYIENGKEVDADMAHLPESYFNAFTRAFTRTSHDGVIVQIHGFEAENRRSGKGAKAEMIISSGGKRAFEPARRTAACLRQHLYTETYLYPDDVRELGATTNIQAEILRKEHCRGFVHIEISKDKRMELKEDAQTRRRFIDCLEGVSP